MHSHKMEKKYYNWLYEVLSGTPNLHQVLKIMVKHSVLEKIRQKELEEQQQQQQQSRQWSLISANCSSSTCPTTGNRSSNVGDNDRDGSAGDQDYYGDYNSFNMSYNDYYDYDQKDWLENYLEELYEILRASQMTTNIALTVFLGIIFIIGFTGNIIVLTVFARTKLKQASTIFIMALATNDLVICSVVLPGVLLKEWSVPFEYDALCRGWEWLRCATIPLSALILVVVAVDRYVLICRVGTLRPISVRQAKFIILIVVLASICHGIPPMLKVGVYQKESPPATGVLYLGLCRGNDILVDQSVIDHYWQGMTAEFVVVLTVVVVLYCLVFRTVYKQNKRWVQVKGFSSKKTGGKDGNIEMPTMPMNTVTENPGDADESLSKKLLCGAVSGTTSCQGKNSIKTSTNCKKGKKVRRNEEDPHKSNMNSPEAASHEARYRSKQGGSGGKSVQIHESLTSLDDGHYSVQNTASPGGSSTKSSARTDVTTIISCTGHCIFSHTKKLSKSYETRSDSQQTLEPQSAIQDKSPKKMGWLKRQTFKMLHINREQREIHEASKMKLVKRQRAKIKMISEETRSSDSGIHHTGSMHNQLSLDTTSQRDVMETTTTTLTQPNLTSVNETGHKSDDKEDHKTVRIINNPQSHINTFDSEQTAEDQNGSLPNTPIMNTIYHYNQTIEQQVSKPALDESPLGNTLNDNDQMTKNKSYEDTLEENMAADENFVPASQPEVEIVSQISNDDNENISTQELAIRNLPNQIHQTNDQSQQSEEAKQEVPSRMYSHPMNITKDHTMDCAEAGNEAIKDDLQNHMHDVSGFHIPMISDVHHNFLTQEGLPLKPYIKMKGNHEVKEENLETMTKDTTITGLGLPMFISSATNSVMPETTGIDLKSAPPATSAKSDLHTKIPMLLKKLCDNKVHPFTEKGYLEQDQKLTHREETSKDLSTNQKSKTQCETSLSSPPPQQQQPRTQGQQGSQKRYSAAQVKTAKVLLLVTIVYVLSFAPVLLMILAVIPSHPIPFYGYFIHSAANPLIYSFINQTFRNQLRRLFRRRPG